jgi:uncharacterized OsmC-like protein
MELSLAPGDRTQTRLTSRIAIVGDLSERERIILLNSARHCDVHKILRGQVALQDELVINGAE